MILLLEPTTSMTLFVNVRFQPPTPVLVQISLQPHRGEDTKPGHDELVAGGLFSGDRAVGPVHRRRYRA